MTGKTLCKISGAAESAHLCNFADGHACILQQRPRILQAFFLQKLNGRKFRILLPVPVKRPFAETELPDKLLQTDFIHEVSGEIGGDFADPRRCGFQAEAGPPAGQAGRQFPAHSGVPDSREFPK